MKKRAATLAVGTEITDGQITDRNSAWISKKLVESGIHVVQHRAVADDHFEIQRALLELIPQVDLLFITGGLGPTSDDFTREIISQYCQRPLLFNKEAWQRIESRFLQRGRVARPIQRQQCYFPDGSQIYVNPIGTADAFSLSLKVSENHQVWVFALPGPPSEIAAIWDVHLDHLIDSLVPKEEREFLLIYQTLGKGESEIAEIIEPLLAGQSARIGYRAHVPYVEVKIWFSLKNKFNLTPRLEEVEKNLAPWIVARQNENILDILCNQVKKGLKIRIHDFVSFGELQQRLSQRIQESQTQDKTMNDLKNPLGHLTILSYWGATASSHEFEIAPFQYNQLNLLAIFFPQEDQQNWILRVYFFDEESQNQPVEAMTREILPTPVYNFNTSRGQKYATEKMILELNALLNNTSEK